jgi:altronate dehydratase
MSGDHKLYGYLRHDGRKGIRNYLVVSIKWVKRFMTR